MPICRLSLTLFMVCATANLAQGQSFGRWGMPSTLGQFFGCGNSAGHHAPLIRMPGAKPLHVRRLAIIPPHERMPDSGKYPPTAYSTYDGNFNGNTTDCTHYGHGHWAPHAAPQQPVYQHSPQPTLAPAAHQPVFSAPSGSPKTPAAKKPAAKKTVVEKMAPKKKRRPRRATTPPATPSREKPEPKPEEKNTLPEPKMPTSDPLATPDDRQATYGF